MAVVDVNPSPYDWNGTFRRYTKISKGAKDAFEGGEILRALKGQIPVPEAPPQQ
jgi:hypothetical protein